MTQSSVNTTIVIPYSRDPVTLMQCLASIEIAGRGLKYEVLIVSKYPAPEIATLKSKHVRIITQTRKGLIGAMNDALEHVSTPLFTRIDDDVVVHPTWLRTIYHQMENPQIGGITGPTTIPEDEHEGRDLIRFLIGLEKNTSLFLRPLRWFILSFIYESKLRIPGLFVRSGAFTLGSNFPESLNLKTTVDVDYAEACNYTFRTDVMKQCDRFDEWYTKGLSEFHEPDMAMRVRRAGYRIVFDSGAGVTHHIGHGVPASRGEVRYRIRNFIYFYRAYLMQRPQRSFLRFAANIFMQNCYYMYTFFTTRDRDNLQALVGTIEGFLIPIRKKE